MLKSPKKPLGLENFNLMTSHIAYNSGHTVLDHNTIVTKMNSQTMTELINAADTNTDGGSPILFQYIESNIPFYMFLNFIIKDTFI